MLYLSAANINSPEILFSLLHIYIYFFTLKDFLFEARGSKMEYIVGRFLDINLKSSNQFLNLKIRALTLVSPDCVSHSQ